MQKCKGVISCDRCRISMATTDLRDLAIEPGRASELPRWLAVHGGERCVIGHESSLASSGRSPDMMKLGWVLALGALLATGLETGGATGADVAWAGLADVAGTAGRAQALAPEMAALVDTERAFAKMSVQKGRRDAFLAFFGEDAVFFSPEPVNARQRILAWPAVAAFNLDWEPHFGDLAGAGDLGYTTGKSPRRREPDARGSGGSRL